MSDQEQEGTSPGTSAGTASDTSAWTMGEVIDEISRLISAGGTGALFTIHGVMLSVLDEDYELSIVMPGSSGSFLCASKTIGVVTIKAIKVVF